MFEVLLYLSFYFRLLSLSKAAVVTIKDLTGFSSRMVYDQDRIVGVH